MPVQEKLRQCQNILDQAKEQICPNHINQDQLHQPQNYKYYVKWFTKYYQEIKNHDFSRAFDKQSIVFLQIISIADQWDYLKAELKQTAQKYLNLCKTKIQQIPFSNIIYSTLLTANNRLAVAMNYKAVELQQSQQIKSECLLHHFINQQLTKFKTDSIFFIRDQATNNRIALYQFISKTKQYFLEESWLSIYQQIGQQCVLRSGQEEELKKLEAKQTFLQNVFYQKTSDMGCLGCTTFLYQKSNCYNASVSKCILALGGPIERIKQNSNLIKQQICALMNGRGGVIMFNCIQNYLNVIPFGQFISQKKKDMIEQTIQNYLNYIYPRPEIGTNITISFVPIMQSPFELDKEGKIQNKIGNRKYVPGLYVVRIRVNPTQGRNVYFCTQNQIASVAIRYRSLLNQPEFKRIYTGKEIPKIIKEKHREYAYECNESLSQQQRFYLQKPVSNFDHECGAPDSGQFIVSEVEFVKQKQTNLQNKYRFASLLVAQKKYHLIIKQRLLRMGIKCDIQNPYETHKFRVGKNSAIIYHNNRFDEMLNAIGYNKQFQFDGKFTIIILITDHIKLTQRSQVNQMKYQQFQQYLNHLLKQHPQEELSMFRFVNEFGDIEYFLKTRSKNALYMLYMMLCESGEKSIFKNPKHLQKMTRQQKQGKLMLCHRH